MMQQNSSTQPLLASSAAGSSEQHFFFLSNFQITFRTECFQRPFLENFERFCRKMRKCSLSCFLVDKIKNKQANKETRSVWHWQCEVLSSYPSISLPTAGAALPQGPEQGDAMAGVVWVEVRGEDTWPGHHSVTQQLDLRLKKQVTTQGLNPLRAGPAGFLGGCSSCSSQTVNWGDPGNCNTPCIPDSTLQLL